MPSLVYLKDTNVNNGQMLNKLHRSPAHTPLNSSVNDVIPDNYMTGEDFWKEADKRIIDICKRYGVL